MKQVFPMIPGGVPVLGTLSGIGLFLLALVALFAYFAYASRHVRFEVSNDGLRIRGDLYGRFIPRQELLTDLARPLDLTADRDRALSWRTNGLGLPGYKSGWFKLKNGEKALVFVTNPRSVAYVPTRQGYSVLMSVEDPTGLIRALGQSSSSGG